MERAASSSLIGRQTLPASQPQIVGSGSLPGQNPGVGTSASVAGTQQVGAVNPVVNPAGSSSVDASVQLGRSATSQEGVIPANA